MKIRQSIFGAAMVSLSLLSCGDKMDYHEYTAFDHSYIDRNFEYVGGFMTTIYNDLDADFGNFSGAMLSSATDESEFSTSGNAIEDFYNGAWSPANPRPTIWKNAWEGITYCNEFLDNWMGLDFPEFAMNKDYEKKLYQYNNYKYECRWARAYFYFTLVRQYGAVPLKTHNLTGAEEAALPRVSSDSIFAFIDAECEDIQDSIIKDYTDLGDMALASPETGRANKYAVMALRAQAALYHASPLFNPTNDVKRWYKAAKACQALIDSCQAAGKTLAKTYSNLWATDFYSNSEAYGEILFARRVGASRAFESYNFPVGYSSGQGGNCPTQDLVDAYCMTNGKSINEQGSGYDAQNPYANRDPRFNMTIAHNGEVWPNDLVNTTHTTLETYVGGFHGRPTTSYATPTGYYLKKYCNPSQILRTGYQTTSAHGWLTFRLGAAYLDYAEALFQYFKAQGKENAADETNEEFKHSAREMASMTRQRAGIPSFNMGIGNDEFWESYKNERRVELAFEGHRFYDVRRWKEDGEKFMNIHRMEIIPVYAEDGTTISSYTYTTVSYTRGNGKWLDKWNLFPIPQTEIMKSGEVLSQNPGW
jgi:hypothetical protein